MALIWRDGIFHKLADFRLDPDDRGLWLGESVFETMAYRAGAIAHLPLHLARLARGCAVLGLSPALPPPVAWNRIAAQLIEALAPMPGRNETAVLRLTVTGGPGPRGLRPPAEIRPVVLMRAFPLTPMVSAPKLARVSIKIAPALPFSAIKTGARLAFIAALREAQAAGAAEAVIGNPAGAVIGASAANLYALIGEEWRTPPLADGALAGVTRERLLAAGRLGPCRLVERSLPMAELGSARAIALSNAVTGVRLAGALDGATLPSAPEALRAAVAAFNGGATD